MTRPRLPDGFRVRLHTDVDLFAHDGVLVGGSPLRALRLAPGARRLLRDLDARCVLEVRDRVTATVAERLLDGNFADPVMTGRPPVPATDVTVVIPVRDRAQQLDGALTALTGIRCLVVDDASREPLKVAAVAARHGADLVQLTENLGPAGARNAGLAHVRTPYVALVDSDVVAHTDVLLSLCRHFVDPRVALVGPVVRGRAPDNARWFERYDAAASSLDLGDRSATVRPRASVAWLPGACLVARTSVLQSSEIRGFDAELRVGEDVDLVWRLVAAGSVVRYDSSVRVEHETRSSIRGWLGRKVVYGSGSALLGQRHGDHVAPAQLSPAMATAAGALLIGGPGAIPVAALGMGWSVRRLLDVLPKVPGRRSLALRLSVRGLGWAIRQESSLLLREWWPITLAAILISPSARRAAAAAVLVDSTVALATTRRGAGVATVLVGRRLDDVAYGLGVWLGVLRIRSVTALLPRGSRSR